MHVVRKWEYFYDCVNYYFKNKIDEGEAVAQIIQDKAVFGNCHGLDSVFVFISIQA